MSLRINHNIASINGQKNLTKNDAILSKSLERLSSGMKINKASDNAAGLVISEQMRAQIAGLNQANDNTSSAVSMVQTAEGALDEVSSLLTKARELALHAANEGVNDSNQLVADQNELDNVVASISRIGQSTQFGTKKILDGSLNGSTALSAGLNRVKVGNLANNAAISAGTVTVSGSIVQEANTVTSTSTQTGDGFVYNTTGVVTGFNTTANVVSGVVAKVTIDGTDYSSTTTGATSMTGIADKLTAAVAAASGGYTVTYNAGAFTATRNLTSSAPSTADFTTVVTLSKAATSTATVAGSGAAYTMSVTLNSGGTQSTASGASSILFGAGAYASGLTNASTTATSGMIFTLQVSTSTGMFSIKVSGAASGSNTTYANGDTLGSVLSALAQQLADTGSSLGLSAANSFTGGATLNVLTGSIQSGFQVKLQRSNDGVSGSFSASLRIDYNSSPVATPAVYTFDLTGIYVGSSGAAVSGGLVTGAGLNGTGIVSTTGASGGNTLTAGNALTITVNGQSFIATGNQTLDAVATSLTSQIQAVAGLTGVVVAFAESGEVSGLAGLGGSNATGVHTMSGSHFIVYDASGKTYNFTMSLDQQNALDLAAAKSTALAGVQAGATLNLDTSAGSAAAAVGTVSGTSHSAVSLSTTGQTTTSGASTFTAVTANGVTLSLVATGFSTSGAGTLVIDSTNTANNGYRDLIIEINTGMVATGGSATFTLNNGAEFQIGANANTTGFLDQKVGVTIEKVDASELGRNASGRGTINSLNDLVSSSQGALINGKTTEALKVIDKAIDDVTNMRGKLGAFQANTLETNLNSLRTANENLTAAESTIRDTDFAAESAAFTKNQILVQSATAMLAQANQLPQGVLSLLR